LRGKNKPDWEVRVRELGKKERRERGERKDEGQDGGRARKGIARGIKTENE